LKSPGSEQIEFDLFKAIAVLCRDRLIIIAGTVLATLAATLYVAMTPQEYEVSVKTFVHPSQDPQQTIERLLEASKFDWQTSAHIKLRRNKLKITLNTSEALELYVNDLEQALAAITSEQLALAESSQKQMLALPDPILSTEAVAIGLLADLRFLDMFSTRQSKLVKLTEPDIQPRDIKKVLYILIASLIGGIISSTGVLLRAQFRSHNSDRESE